MPGLYIHIPFCKSKCRYCDFLSFANMDTLIPVYLLALQAEMQALSALCPPAFDTIFLGGGTPTLLRGKQLYDFMAALRSVLPIAPDAEITMECNPGTVDREKLQAYYDAGVNRISIGLQSLDDALLLRIGRVHTAAQFLETYAAALNAGFKNINVDIMHGLPGQTHTQYLNTVHGVIALAPQHISAYELILEESTPLFADVESGVEKMPDECETYFQQDIGIETLIKHGYARYEISNFAQSDFGCRHNINYWENGAYLGIGAGAHSAWRLDNAWMRWANTTDLHEYIQAPAPQMEQRALQRIPLHEEAFETVMLGLRMVRGLSLDDFHRRYGASFTEVYPVATAKLIHANWLKLEDGRAYLTAEGLDMQNLALQYFMTYPTQLP